MKRGGGLEGRSNYTHAHTHTRTRGSEVHGDFPDVGGDSRRSGSARESSRTIGFGS